MQQETKILCYQKAYQMLKDMEHVTDLRYPDNKRNLEFNCNIGSIQVEYNLRLNTDLLTIRGTKKYPGLTDSQLTEIGLKITKEEKFMFTAYNENIIFQLSLPIVGIADENAKQILEVETEAFINFLNRIEFKRKQINVGNAKMNQRSIPEKRPNNNEDCDVEHKPIQSDTEQDDSVKLHSDLVEPDSNTGSDTFGLDNIDFGDTDSKEPATTEDQFEKVSDSVKSESASENISENSEDREKRLLQMEWLGEKTALNKRKENELDERELLLMEKEEEINAKLTEIEEKEMRWGNIEEKYSEKELFFEDEQKRLDAKKSELQAMENNLQEKDAEMQRQSDTLKEEAENIKALENEIAERERSLKIEKESLESERKEFISEKSAFENDKQKFLENQPKLTEENKSLRERCIFLQNEIKEKDAAIATSEDWKTKEEELLNTIEDLKADNEAVSISLSNANENFNNLVDQIKTLEIKSAEKEQIVCEKDTEISKLKSEIELYKKSGIEMSAPDDILEDFADTRKLNRQLERELNDLKDELKTETTELQVKIEQIEEEKAALIKEAQEKEKSRLPENLAVEYLKQLKACGIILKQEEINEDICLTGERDNCSILINVNKNIIIVKKNVFRANKLTAKLQEWNETEVSETYYNDKRMVACKRVINDVTIDTNKVLQKFALIK